jgi:hypothetical protein
MKRVLTSFSAGAHAESALLQIAGPRVPGTPTVSCRPTVPSSRQACRHWPRALTYTLTTTINTTRYSLSMPSWHQRAAIATHLLATCCFGACISAVADCWATRARDTNGQLQADRAKFPSGMQALAESIHQKGLQFGIYADAGLFTCAGFPGSRWEKYHAVPTHCTGVAIAAVVYADAGLFTCAGFPGSR